MYFVYILECADKSFYTGITGNIDKRVTEHNSGSSLSTKSRLPVRLAYWEKALDKFAAAKREKEIKGWRREKKIRLIESLH